MRLDLHGTQGRVDGLATLLAIREGVAQLKSRWPLFDLSLAAYWSAVRPGEDFPTFRGSAQVGNAVVETLGDALSDLGSLADLAGTGVGGGLAVRGVKKLVSEARKRKDIRLGVAAYPGFRDFLLRCADEPSRTQTKPELLCEIAGTLAWEITQVMPHPLIVVFVDTVERLKLDRRRTSEAFLNQLVYEMPNLLFVATGREMLDWWKASRVDLTYRGPWCWPGLSPEAASEPRQNLVGRLSPSDTRTVVELGRSLLDLPIPDNLVPRLAEASDGLPQYLELARQVAISIKESGTGEPVTEADVTGSLDSLVVRVLDDIPPDEQRVIRAAALFREFHLDLVAATAGVEDGCARRAVDRPMIDRDDGDPTVYRMHDAVRTALRTTDHGVPGGWSEHDWSRASTRAAAFARLRHDEAKQRGVNRDVLDAIGLAVSLTCDQETELEPSSSPNYQDWLSRAIVFAPSISALRGRVPTSSRTEYGKYILAFIEGKSLDVPLDQRIANLNSVFMAEHPLSEPAGRHLGYTLRTRYEWGDALRVFQELIDKNPSAVNRMQIPITLSSARRFAEASESLATVPEAQEITHRMASYAHGDAEVYFREVDAKLARLQEQGRQREHIEEAGTLLVRRALFHNDLTEPEIGTFLSMAEFAVHSQGVRDGLLASILLRDCSDSEREARADRLRALEKVVRPDLAIGFRSAMADLADAVLLKDQSRIGNLATLVSRVEVRSRSWIPVEMLLDALGYSVPVCPTQWLEPLETVKARWRSHWNGYLLRHGGSLSQD